LALHGVGENHEDYLLKWQVAAAKYHTIVVAPQMKWPVPLTTEYLHYLIDFIDDLSQKYPIDPSRMYVAGASAGGAIGLHLAVDYPERFRGAVIISSIGFDTCLRTGNKLDKIKDYESLPQLLFVHGMKDTVLFETVLNGMEFLLEHGVKAQLYNYDNAGHEHRPEWNKRIFQWIEKVEKSPRNLAIPANS
jgi:predicted esterase